VILTSKFIAYGCTSCAAYTFTQSLKFVRPSGQLQKLFSRRCDRKNSDAKTVLCLFHCSVCMDAVISQSAVDWHRTALVSSWVALTGARHSQPLPTLHCHSLDGANSPLRQVHSPLIWVLAQFGRKFNLNNDRMTVASLDWKFDDDSCNKKVKECRQGAHFPDVGRWAHR